MGSRHCGKPIKRERIWILASNRSKRWKASRQREVDSELKSEKENAWEITTNRENNIRLLRGRYTNEILSRDFRGDDVMASRMDRLTAIGNGQDASLAALAWRILTNTNKNEL